MPYWEENEQFACDLVLLFNLSKRIQKTGKIEGEKFKLPGVMSCFSKTFFAPGKIHQ